MKNTNCASCYDFSIDKVIKSSPELRPVWLEKNDYVSMFVNNYKSFQVKTQKNYNVYLKLSIGKQYKGHVILYWAANPDTTNSPVVSKAKQAYGNFENRGVTQVNNDGFAIFKFLCPQLYKTQRNHREKFRTFYRHLHFVISNKEKNEWNPQIYTKVVVCKHDFNKSINIIKSNNTVILNALPCEYYAKDHIPNSYNLNKDMIKKMSFDELKKWIKEVVELHYPKLNTLIKNGKLEIYEVPLLFYCAHSKCNASDLAIEEIMKKGFVNVQVYSGGIVDYRKHIPHD